MTPNDSEKLVTTESEISSNGVGHSKMQGSDGEALASQAELSKALLKSQETIEALTKEIEDLKVNKSDNSVDKLAEVLAAALNKATPQAPVDTENLNKSADFREAQLTLDGKSLMEAQQELMAFRNEEKVPVSIPKSFQAQFGPALAIPVNGVRVSIPVDGKTYYINKTHAIHAKERIAKVDRLLSDDQPQVEEINA